MSYTVVPLRLEEHRDALVQLWKRNFENECLDAHADRRLEWLYQEHPFGAPRTWLAVETGSGEVIGCGSVVPSQLYIRGRVVRIGTLIDFSVDVGHRSGAAALAIQRTIAGESRRAGFEALIGKPNKKALPIFSRLGYRPVGETKNLLKAIAAEPDTGVGRSGQSYEDEFVTAADGRCDDLWNRSKSQCQIAGMKTSAHLNWRYLAFKEMGYDLYCLVHREDRRLVGYIVFSRVDRGAFIAELLSEDLGGRALEDLLLGFAGRMQREGQEWIALSYLGDPAFEDRMKRLGFVSRTRSTTLIAYVDPDSGTGLRDEMFDSRSSLVFGGEMDVF
jgi:Acetyltransferase (GNAT) domain